MFKTLALYTVAGAAMAAAFLHPPSAHADEGSYINGVGSRGVPITSATLKIGHQVCYDVALNGVAGFDNEARQAINAGVSSHDAAVLIVEAVYQLCPSNMAALHAYLADDTTAEA